MSCKQSGLPSLTVTLFTAFFKTEADTVSFRLKGQAWRQRLKISPVQGVCVKHAYSMSVYAEFTVFFIAVLPITSKYLHPWHFVYIG